MDIQKNIQQYLDGKGKNKGLKPDERYSSFDYCFNYFQQFKVNNNITELASNDNIESSCLQVAFYLASWGMLRGSSFLLEKSYRCFIPLIVLVSDYNPIVWNIDVPTYTDDNINILIACANSIKKSFGNKTTDTLVTKIMLGIFGNVPAFDTNFCNGFKMRTFNPNSLKQIAKIYQDNKEIIDNYKICTFDFKTGKISGRRYTKAKIIDMVGFIEGLNNSMI